MRSTHAVPPLVLSNGSLLGVPFEDRVAAAAGAGFASIGFSLREYRRCVRQDGLDLTRMLRVLGHYGMRVSELETYVGFSAPENDRGGPFAAALQDLRLTDKRDEAEIYELATTLEVPILQALGTYGTPILEPEAVHRFAALCDRVAPYGLSVALEFLPGTNVPDPTTAQRVVVDAGCANGGICFDSWHWFRGTSDDAIPDGLDADRILMIQLNDGPLVPVDPDYLADCISHRLAPGSGEFDLQRLMSRLWQIGVDLPIGVEVLNCDHSGQTAGVIASRLASGTREVLGEPWASQRRGRSGEPTAHLK